MIQKNADGPVPDESQPEGSGETLAEVSPDATATEELPSDRGIRAVVEPEVDDGLDSDPRDDADPDEAAAAAGDALEVEARDPDSDGQDAASEADGSAPEASDPCPASDAPGEAEGSDGAEAAEASVDDELPPSEAEPETPSEPSAPPCDRPLGQRLEAVLFASGQPLPPAKLARVLSVPLEQVKAALEDLVGAWEAREGAIDLVAIAGGFRFMTRPAFQADLQGLARKGKTERLSPAALETLSIVAYKQPITRADIEAVRGVAAGPLLRVLLDRDLIRVSGRSPEPGHPLLYGTTKRFLDHFGLESLRQLPDIRDLLDVS